MAYNTGNPIGSGDPRDLRDNSENLDEAINGTASTWVDRLGVTRKTFQAAENAADDAEAAANNAITTLIPAEVQRVTDDANVAINTEIPAEVQRVTDDANVAINTEIPAEVQRAADYVETVLDPDTADALDMSVAKSAMRAESARDAAFVNADVYADTTAGLAATVDGEQFQIAEGDEIVRYRRVDASNAQEVARYTSAAGVSSAIDRVKYSGIESIEAPNALTLGQILFEEMPITLGDTAVTPLSIFGRKALKANNASNGVIRFLWRIPTSEFSSGFISAGIKFLSCDAGTSGEISITQRDSSLTSISSYEIADGLVDAITDGKEFSAESIPLEASASYIDFDITLSDTTNLSREVVVQSPLLSDGGSSLFRLPDFIDNYDSLAEAIKITTNVRLEPFKELQVLTQQGDIQYERVFDSLNGSLLLGVDSNLGSSKAGFLRLSDTGIADGVVVRMSGVCTSVSSADPAIGIAFGDATNARGYALRSNGQNLDIRLPDYTTLGAAGPDSGGFSTERLTVDARLAGGVSGNYTVRFYAEKSDGSRFGPYDIAGIESLDSTWLVLRSASEWTDIALTFHKAPFYVDEFLQSAPTNAVGALVYVATDGNDENPGTQQSPFATFSKAIAELAPAGGTLEIAGGEYRETLDLSPVTGKIEVRAPAYERAIVFGSDQLTITKTSGYTQVYESPLTNKPTGMGGSRGPAMIFEHGTPSKPIPDAERHDLQRGETHRLPFTQMLEAASIAELDTVDGRGMWFWENGIIYLAATDGGDATAKRYETRVRPSVIGSADVRLHRIDAFYSSSNGMTFVGCQKIYREECRAMGSYSNGFNDDACITVAIRDQAAANGNDGANGHAPSGYATTGNREGSYAGTYFDPWYHDNYDDGHSYHQRGEASIHGGLMEDNSKAGVVQVAGASVVCYGTTSRGAAHGFYAATDPADQRTNATVRCHNTIATGNGSNYTTANNGVLLAYDCVSRDATSAGYTGSAEGKLEASNCRHSGSGAATSGNVTVINDPLLS